jgi:prepilin-type N-terminal cleavage/methylation domain-containing protein
MLEMMKYPDSVPWTDLSRRRERGFTLLEMLAVIMIVALMVAIGYPMMRRSLVRAEMMGQVKMLQTSLAICRMKAIKESQWVALELLEDGETPAGGKIYGWVDSNSNRLWDEGSEEKVGEWYMNTRTAILTDGDLRPLFTLSTGYKGVVFIGDCHRPIRQPDPPPGLVEHRHRAADDEGSRHHRMVRRTEALDVLMDMNSRPRVGSEGFTLVEILIMMVILSFVALGIAGLFSHAMIVNASGHDYALLASEARLALEALQARPFTDPVLDQTGTGEEHAWAPVNRNFTIVYTVGSESWNAPTSGTGLPTDTANLKRVTMTVASTNQVLRGRRVLTVTSLKIPG